MRSTVLPSAVQKQSKLAACASTTNVRVSGILIVALVVAFAAFLIPQETLRSALLGASAAALSLLGLMWVMRQTAGRRQRMVRTVMRDLFGNDQTPAMLANADGEVLFSNASADRRLPTASIQTVAASLSKTLANPAAIVRRLQAKAAREGSAWEELATRNANHKLKVHLLEDRLNHKKEQLLEKELVLEEVSMLADKLRAQASEGRSDTLHLAKKVNDFQARIKNTTRKMMATVSELSMYQATAMKLQQEKHDREVEVEESRWKLEQGEPPNESALHEWYRVERKRLQHDELVRQQQMQQSNPNIPLQATKTTAEPRPNAYIPEHLGIPKPYGGQAPFKPTDTGSTMRHIRRPENREIEI